MTRKAVHTDKAPGAVGTYSQAMRAGSTVYLSGQIPLDPATMDMAAGDMEARTRRAFLNLAAVAEAAGGSLGHMVKITVYLTDMGHFPVVNRVMEELFSEPYPARAALGVASLPKGADVEVEGIMVLDD
jgi:reactive intermediate/imine deaminase